MERNVEHEVHGQRGIFFIAQNGKRLAEMTYRRVDASLVIIDHTEVAESLRGKGVARELLDAAVAWARDNETRLGSTCSYASAVFDRDSSLRDVVA